MKHCEQPRMLHNMSAPPRTVVKTMLPVLCAEGGGGQAPLFSLPHALVLAGRLKAGQSRCRVMSQWLTDGGLASHRLWLEASQVKPSMVSGRWESPRSLLRHLGLKTVPEVPSAVHFLTGMVIPYSSSPDGHETSSQKRCYARPVPPRMVYRIVPDPALTLAVLSRCCGGVLYGSRTPELEWSTLLGGAVVFDDPVLRDLCFTNPPLTIP